MKRYPGLDFLRAVAILCVVFYHGTTEGLGTPIAPLGRLGWMGVDLFFVLSGYLIGSQLLKLYAEGKTPSLGSFYLRRAFRILPAYWVVLAFYFFAPSFREFPGIQPAWEFLTFTENLLVDYRHYHAFSHAWSLCVEEHFYLFFPLLAWVLMRRPSWKLTATVCIFLVLGGMILRTCLWLHYIHGGAASTGRPGYFAELLYYPTHVRLDGLLAGVVLAAIRWFRPVLWERALRQPYWLLAGGVTGMAAAIWIASDLTTFAGTVFGYPLLSASMALLVVACVSPRFVLGRRKVPGARLIAAITFSLYLSHKMTWHIVKIYLPDLVRPGGVQAFLVYATAAFVVGSLLYLVVERPFLLLRDRLDGQREPAAPNAVTSFSTP